VRVSGAPRHDVLPRPYVVVPIGGAFFRPTNLGLMHPFPHSYSATATADADGDIRLDSDGLPSLVTSAPAEFGGPGDRWSPETLLMGAVADCFILTFRAVAKASSLPWTALTCEAEGVLDRVDRVTLFTEIRVRASLRVPPGADEVRALQVLERAEKLCLVTNSLSASAHLDARVEVTEAALA
jgi:organic hydroperoxide reductase OsmC/OhrA